MKDATVTVIDGAAPGTKCKYRHCKREATKTTRMEIPWSKVPIRETPTCDRHFSDEMSLAESVKQPRCGARCPFHAHTCTNPAGHDFNHHDATAGDKGHYWRTEEACWTPHDHSTTLTDATGTHEQIYGGAQ